MPNTAAEAIKTAKRWLDPGHKPFAFKRYCLKITRTALGINAKYPSAQAAWDGAQHRHKFTTYDSVPKGVAFFWRGPSKEGHVVLTVGDGYCLSNDIGGPGTYRLVHMSTITKRWGATPLGWTEDLNGVRYYTKPVVKKPAKPTVSVKKYLAGVNGAKPTAGQRATVSRVKRALRERVSLSRKSPAGRWDALARQAAKRWQTLLGDKADGVLGPKQLTRLGKSPKVKSKFKVTD